MKKVILRTGICFVLLLTLFISSGILSVKAEASHQTRTTTLDLSAAADSYSRTDLAKIPDAQ